MVITGAAAAESLTDACWLHPTRSLRVEMGKLPLASLPQRALAGLKANPQFEIGGVLLGYILSVLGETRIVITGVEFVPAVDPHYNTSPADTHKLVEAFRSYNDGDSRAIGFFRSHFRDGLCLTEHDAAVMNEHFPDPNALCLLVRPFQMGVCMAGFFLRQNGQLETQFTDFEVPMFVPEDLSSTNPRDEGPEQALVVREKAERKRRTAPAVAEPATTETPEAAAAVTEPKRNSKWLKLVALAVFGIGMAAGAYWLGMPRFRSVWPSSQPVAAAPAAVPTAVPVQAGLGLQVDRHADSLELQWNSAVFASTNPQNGELTISDGSLKRTLEIDAAQLRSGKIQYFPTNTDVTFELRANLDANRVVSESVRVVLPNTGSSMNADAAKSVEHTYIPPHAIKRVLPISRETDDSGTVERRKVQVVVSVDETGAVTSAQAANVTGTAAELCVQAAKQWQFEPARLDGRAVRARYTVTFDWP